ncbi:MAG: SDR family oxidoreductase [Candidatus Omnitrophica bacterium]|nr:SDR family oxidoreductase [Candidatus Omnitrophota bacterium]
MHFLVTGGAGFIGSNIAEALISRGHSVRVLDNFSSGKKENLQFAYGLRKNRFQLIRGDIRDKDTCHKACQGIDYVLHHAALRSVPGSIKEPQIYNDVNINGTLFMLQAAFKKGVRRFVFASSSSVYGDIAAFPEKECFLPDPISPYALTKLTGEYYCRIFSVNWGLETVILRYFNVFGPKQALDDEYAVVVPKFINCLLAGKNPPIFGNGKQSRDFIYIENVVQANILASFKQGIKTGVFNIASGKDQTVLQLLSALNRITGQDIKPSFLPKRPGDIFKTRADISQANKLLGYRPKVNFREGLHRTVDYMRSQVS